MGLSMSSTFATFNSAYLLKNIKNGWWPTFAPVGYENYGEKPKRYIRPVPDSAKLVLLAFQLFTSGDYSISSLTETMQKKKDCCLQTENQFQEVQSLEC